MAVGTGMLAPPRVGIPTRGTRRAQLPAELPGNWWETPGLAFDTAPSYYKGGGGTVAIVPGRGGAAISGTPAWWTGSGNLDDPAAFYNWYQRHGTTPEAKALRDDYILNMMSTSEANAARERDRLAGLDTLRGTGARYQSELDRLRNDPTLGDIESTFGARATGRQPLVGMAEQEAYNQELRQSISRAINAASGSAAARGVAGGGLSMQRDADILRRGVTEGVGLRSNIETQNRRAQDAALESLGTFRVQREALESSIVDEIARVDAAIAAIEAGGQYAPTDFLPFSELEFGRQQLAEEQRRAEEERAALREDVEEFDPTEFANTVLVGSGAGPWGVPLSAGLYLGDTVFDWW